MTDLELAISKIDKPHDRVLTLLRSVPESYLSTACICRLCNLTEREGSAVLLELRDFGRITVLSPSSFYERCYWSIA